MGLEDFFAEGHDLDEWFPAESSQSDAEAMAVGAFNIETATYRDLRETSACATALAELLRIYGWRMLSSALLVALRGQAEPS